MKATSTWRRRALTGLAAAGFAGSIAAASIATPALASTPAAAVRPHAAGSYCLYEGQTLTGGQDVIWQNLEVVMGTDGNLVMVDLVDGNHAVWANGESGHPGAYLIMQGDGNLVEYSSTGTALWWTGTQGHSGAYACVSPWAGFYVYYGGTTFLWHTSVWGFLDTTRNGTEITSDRFAGQSLTGANGSEIDDYEQGYTVYQYNGYLQLRLRSNGQLLRDAGSSCAGAVAGMQSDGNFVIYCNGRAIWATNTGGHPASYGFYLHLQSCDYNSGEGDGVNLAVYSNYGQLEWSWGTCGLT